MCGIVGVVSSGGSGERCLTTWVAMMATAVAHRGPDDQGSWVDEAQGVALGHRRLAILDLSQAAHQPMANETDRIHVVFNGEIYNFPALKRELEQRGHVFRSKTDSEVIVHAYEEYGERFVERLDGMFAFALWDQDVERLVLARDRPGKKPLYYHPGESLFLFGSEVKAILAHPRASRELDRQALPLYFTYGYVPSPGTFYKHVFQVPPASYLVVERGQIRGPFNYWKLNFPAAGEESRLTEQDACDGIRGLLAAAVERRLLSDVPLGAFLSGGLDSSIVVGLMSRLSGRRVKTFSIGFSGDPAFDETPYAREVARHFDTDHTEFVVEPKAFDLVDRLLWHHDQPYGDSSAIPTYLLCRLAKDHVTVALNGDGGDELFAGYGRFRQALLSEWIPTGAVTFGRCLTDLLSRNFRRLDAIGRVEHYLAVAAKPLNQRYLGWCSFFSPDLLAQLLPEPLPAAIGESFDSCFRETEQLPILHRLLYLNFNTYLPDDLLVKMDRMSMANALETRSPFLDTALMEFVARLPPGFKIRHGRLKYVLKRAFQDFLPPAILARGKQGFSVPLDGWFRGELKGLIGNLLLNETARYRSVLRADCVHRIHQEHQSGVRNWGGELWALMNFEAWLQKQEAAGV